MSKKKHMLLLLVILATMIIIVLVIEPTKKQTPVDNIQPIMPFNIKASYLPVVMNGNGSSRPSITRFGYGIDWREQLFTDELNDKLNATWFHQWLIRPSITQLGGIEFVQHFYCDDQSYFDKLQEHVNLGYAGYLLFLNEPDRYDQCDLTPSEAVDALVRVRSICPTCVLVGPQVSHVDVMLHNWEWLKGFYTEANRRNVQLPPYGGLHTYLSNPPYQGNFIVDSFYEVSASFGYEPLGVWFTEIGGDSIEAVRGMAETCRNDNRVERCAYFSPKCDPSMSFWHFNQHYCIMDMNGNLNDKGVVWSTIVNQ